MTTIPLRVLGDRVLVKPDINPNAPVALASGVIVAKSLAAAVTGRDETTSVCRGTVIAVGRPKHPLRQEAFDLADRVSRVMSGATPWMPEDDHAMLDAAHMLRDLVRKQSCVSVGDDVLFSHDAGQETVIDGETYLILHEPELLAVVVYD